jgi:hypothetical protein
MYLNISIIWSLVLEIITEYQAASEVWHSISCIYVEKHNKKKIKVRYFIVQGFWTFYVLIRYSKLSVIIQSILMNLGKYLNFKYIWWFWREAPELASENYFSRYPFDSLFFPALSTSIARNCLLKLHLEIMQLMCLYFTKSCLYEIVCLKIMQLHCSQKFLII